ncbi:MAG: rRNA adenine dimethyltransferase family protein [Pseudomonadota bacterium]
MGQSFLVSAAPLRALGRAFGGIQGKFDLVIEIGAGPGNLTEALLDEGMRVLAIERDRRLGRLCGERLEGRKGLTLVLADVLRCPLRLRRPGMRIALAGNLPYSIAGEIMKIMTDELEAVEAASIVIQEEVAMRILASPGCRQYGALTLLMQFSWRVRQGIRIRAGSFYPRPRVDSRQLILERKERTGLEPGHTALFKRIAANAFKYRRKKLGRALALAAVSMGLDKQDLLKAVDRAGIDPGLRPENLTLDDYITLTKHLAAAIDRGGCGGGEAESR